ncbi:MAG: hypothetical protein FWD45_04015 [Coriobacteriia bacterium]|nr:hypothetical protein [Coriobacteriia bacterium]
MSQEYVASVIESRKALKKARLDYSRSISRAKYDHNRIITAARKAVNEDQKALDEYGREWLKPLATQNGVSLYNDHVTHGKSTIYFLDSPVTGSIEISGNEYDTCKLFFTISGPGGQICTTGDPDKEASIRNFLTQVAYTSNSYESKLDGHLAELVRLNNILITSKLILQAAEADNNAIAFAEEDTGAVVSAEAVYHNLLYTASQSELDALALYDKKVKRRNIIFGAIAAAAVVLAAVMLVLMN